ncbi:lysophospholipid acyltransferase family protein [Rhizobium sp.]
MKQFLIQILASLFSAYAYLVLVTCRIQVVTALPKSLVEGPVVLASWHQQVLMLPVMGRPSRNRLLALVADSRSGTFIRTVASWFGIGTVHGSRRRGGAGGALALIDALRQGHSVFITPDGSRGPARRAKHGATEVARLTGTPLIPCAAWPVWGKTFDTWDRFRLPFPFTRIRVVYGAPLEKLESGSLTAALNAASDRAQHEG